MKIKIFIAGMILLLSLSFGLFPAACGTRGSNPVGPGIIGDGTQDGGAADGGTQSYNDWMSRYKNRLSDFTLKELVLLGSHDSVTSNINADSPPCIGYVRSDPDSGWSNLDAGPTPAYIDQVRAQSVSVFDQLQAGVRCLDLRVALQDGGFYSEHVWLSLPFEGDGGILDQISSFNKSNPDEIIFILTLPGHIYSDTTADGLATDEQTNNYYSMVQAALPLVQAPSGNYLNQTMGDIWDGGGRIVYYGPKNQGYAIQKYVWNYSGNVDSKWESKAKTAHALIADLNIDVIGPWMDGGTPTQFHVLQAMTNDDDKIANAVPTNAAIMGQLTSAWTNAPINVVQVNDAVEAVDAGMMPLLFNRMQLE